MGLPIIQTMQTMLAGMVAAAQSACSAFLDLSVGSPGRAILEADASQWSVQQANVYDVLRQTRLSTSVGAEVDSFVADYGLTRLPARPATGAITVSLTPSASATIVVGQTVRTGDGSQTYAVTADPTNPLYSANVAPPPGGTAQGGYVAAAGTAPFPVPIQAMSPGSAGNVATGAVSLWGDAIAGVNNPTNAAPIVDGLDAETDAALKIRFVGYIASLERATPAAVLNAIEGVEQGLTAKLLENEDEAGRFAPGHFWVVVDDGSGYPSASLLAAVSAAVDLVRPVTSTFSVQPPQIAGVTVLLTIAVSSGSKAALFAPIQSAITAYVNSLPVGAPVSVFGVIRAASGVSPAIITNVSGVTINGVPADFAPPMTAVAKCVVAPTVS